MSVTDIFMLLGGLGLFLYGMKLMSEGLEAAAGNKMRRWLEVLVKNRAAGVAVGAGVTIAVQSSSATTVMVIGFVNAGIMTLKQAVTVCMGANIGTTLTAQILVFDFDAIAPLILFVGIVMCLFIKKKTVQNIGQIVAGFGVLFMGMMLMSDSTASLKDWPPFIDILASFQNPLIGILAGTLITAIMQASGAVMGMLLALASTGLITLDNSMYVILGLNIGTCITAVLASLGANKTAKRTAVVHVLFNVIGALIFILLLNILPVKEWIEAMSPGNIQRQLANFHMIFNIVTTLILIWVPDLLIKVACLVVRGEDGQEAQRKLQYLTPPATDNPAMAVGLAIREVGRMGILARTNFERARQAFLDRDTGAVKEVQEQEELVNYLNQAITDALVKLNNAELGWADAGVVASLLHIITDIERISDHAENIAEFTVYEVENRIELSPEGEKELTLMMDKVSQALGKAVSSLVNGSIADADEVIVIEAEVDKLEIALKNSHIERVAKGICNPRGSMMYADMITNLERVADHSTNIAYRVLKDGIYRN